MEEKVRTYWIHCKEPELKGGVRIVASDEDSARQLFNEYCLNELGLDKPYTIHSMGHIYVPADAAEYGDRYDYPSATKADEKT